MKNRVHWIRLRARGGGFDGGGGAGNQIIVRFSKGTKGQEKEDENQGSRHMGLQCCEGQIEFATMINELYQGGASRRASEDISALILSGNWWMKF